MLEVISIISISIGIIQGVFITIDVVRNPQQMMPIMNIVWPLMGLYFPIIGLIAYERLGKKNRMQ